MYLQQSKVNQDALELEKDALRAQIKQKEAFSVADKVKVEELNNNLLKAGVEIRESMLKKSSLEKVCKDRFEEIETMKAVTKRFSDELAQNKSEMQKLRKDLKQKDKEIYNLENKADNLNDIVKKIKEEKNGNVKEMMKLKKEIKNLEKNNNRKASESRIKTSAKTSLSSMSGSAFLPLTPTIAISSDRLDSSPETFSPASVTATPSTLLGSTLVTSLTKEPVLSVNPPPPCPSAPQLSPSACTPPSPGSSRSTSSAQCVHIPQCLDREPYAPPNPLATRQVFNFFNFSRNKLDKKWLNE